MESYAIDVNRLVNDIKGYIAQLKTTYFENKDPIDDNEIVLQKLCVKLETALRNGMKDKYTFLGMRKDYWNFFSECLPKDEGVRYVNSLSQLHTVQGKGRALIRYCLVQKTLADTIQRTLMRRRKTEWYTQDALLLNNSLSGALIAKLYDLNELEFHLSCTGCDLDMSWPSFGRTFTDGYEKRTRRNSAASIASTTDFANERIDPLVALNAEILALKQMISREMDVEKGDIDDGVGENSMSSTEDAQPNISDITLDISRLHQYILKWKSSMDAKVYKGEHEIRRLREENDRMSQDSNTQLTQLAERHQNLSELASKEATLQINDLQNKLRNAETAIRAHKTKLDNLNDELRQVSQSFRDSQKTVTDMEKELSNSQQTTKKLEDDIVGFNRSLEIQMAEHRELTEENNNLKSELQRLQQNESSLRDKLEESESKLNVKTLEKDKIQEAFENVNGLVFSSFEDFESFYKSQLLDKDKGLEMKDSENRTLQQRMVVLTRENEKLKKELLETFDKQQRSQNELREEHDKHRKQDEEIRRLEVEVKVLVETIEKANTNLSKWLNHNVDEQAEDHCYVRSGEGECRSLVNNLDQLGQHLVTRKESLADVLSEKEKLDSQCSSLSLQVERLVRRNEELENETAESLLDRQGQQRDKSQLEDQIQLLSDEKSTLEDALNSARKEKSDVDLELRAVNDKLQEESYLRIVFEDEVSEITEQLNKEKSDLADSSEAIVRLKREVERAETECETLNVELVKCREELELVSSNMDTAKKELAAAEDMLRKSEKEKEEAKTQISKHEEKVVNLQCTMDQQVSSLRFQLSSEALKYDEEIKTLSREKQEAMTLRDKIQENEETITELENKLKERNETWQTERKKLTGDIKLLKNEIKVLNANIDGDKQEIQSVENTLSISKKKYEKEKSRNQEYRKTIAEMRDQKSENEKILELEKGELEEDIKQLKCKLISLLSDKSELWKRSTQLEFDMKTRLSETWVDDKDVTQCPECKIEFTLFIRRHHCRFCGNVFCHNCSDHFVKTIHSRKPYRACTSCYQKEKELKNDTSWLTNTSLDHGDSQGSDTEEGPLTSTPEKTTRDENKQRPKSEKRTEVLTYEQFDHGKKVNSASNDDSDANYEIIEKSEDSLSAGSLQNDGLSVKHSTTLKPGDGSEDWSDAVIPAGKRYLINVEALSGSQLAVEFTTSEQGMLFGAAIQESANKNDTKTLIPLCQVNSHERCAKKQLKPTSSGTVMFVFDNTHSKSSVQLRFKICRKTNDG